MRTWFIIDPPSFCWSTASGWPPLLAVPKPWTTSRSPTMSGCGGRPWTSPTPVSLVRSSTGCSPTSAPWTGHGAWPVLALPGQSRPHRSLPRAGQPLTGVGRRVGSGTDAVFGERTHPGRLGGTRAFATGPARFLREGTMDIE